MLLKNYKNNSIIIFNVCTITMLDNTYHDKVLRLLEFFFSGATYLFFLCVWNFQYSYFLRHFVLLANKISFLCLMNYKKTMLSLVKVIG